MRMREVRVENGKVYFLLICVRAKNVFSIGVAISNFKNTKKRCKIEKNMCYRPHPKMKPFFS